MIKKRVRLSSYNGSSPRPNLSSGMFEKKFDFESKVRIFRATE